MVRDMPTDVAALLARKKHEEIEAHMNERVILASYVVCLSVFASLFAFPRVAEAMALLGAS